MWKFAWMMLFGAACLWGAQAPENPSALKPFSLPPCLAGPARHPGLKVVDRPVRMDRLPPPFTICFYGCYNIKTDGKGKILAEREIDGHPGGLNDGPPNPDPEERRTIEVFTSSGKTFSGTVHYAPVPLASDEKRPKDWELISWRSSNILIDTDELLVGFRLKGEKGDLLFEKNVSTDQYKEPPTVRIWNNKDKKRSFIYWGKIEHADAWGYGDCDIPRQYPISVTGPGGYNTRFGLPFPEAEGIGVASRLDAVFLPLPPGWPVVIFTAWQGLNPYVKALRSELEWVDDLTFWERLWRDKVENGRRRGWWK